MASISTISKPYLQNGKHLNPVYNTVAYVINSTNNARTNYKYIADIYLNTTLIATLKHNPDLLTKYGVFDAGKILENILSYDYSRVYSNGFNNIGGSLIDYSIKFGEEFSRKHNFVSFSSYFGSLKINSNGKHNARTGDVIYLELDPSSNSFYSTLNQKYFTVNNITTTGIILNTPAVSGTTTGFYSECEKAVMAKTWTDTNNVKKMVYYMPTTLTTRINIGDTINVKKLDGSTAESYETTQTVVNIKTETISGTPYQVFYTDCLIPNGFTTKTVDIVLHSLSNYKFRNVLDLSADKPYVFNGALQYDNFLDWDPNAYMMNNGSSKFLTNSPRTLNINSDEYHTLSFFRHFNTTEFNRAAITVYPNISKDDCQVVNVYTNAIFLLITGDYTNKYKIGDTITYFNGTTSETVNITNVELISGSTRITTNLMAEPGISITNGNVYLVSRIIYDNFPTDAQWKSYKRFDYQVGIPYLSTLSNWPSTHTINHYTVRFQLNSGTNRSELFTFNVKDECHNWGTYRLMFLNLLGGWDYITLNGRPTEGINITKDIYQRKLESIKGSNYTYEIGERGNTVYNVNSTDIVSTFTGYINLETGIWLEELYNSPEVYIMKDNKVYPVIVTNAIYNKPKNVGLINLPIDFTYAYDNNIQRGGGNNQSLPKIITVPPISTPGTWTPPYDPAVGAWNEWSTGSWY